MSIQLKPDEMLEFLRWVDAPQYDALKLKMEVLADELASAVEVNIPELTRRGPSEFEGLGFAGTCAPFEPTNPDDHIPEVLTVFDVEVQQWKDMQNGYDD